MATFKVKTVGTQYVSSENLEITGDYLQSANDGRIVQISSGSGTASRVVFAAPSEHVVYVQRTKD